MNRKLTDDGRGISFGFGGRPRPLFTGIAVGTATRLSVCLAFSDASRTRWLLFEGSFDAMEVRKRASGSVKKEEKKGGREKS